MNIRRLRTRRSALAANLLTQFLLAALILPLTATAAPRSFYMALYFGNDPKATDLAWFFPSENPATRYQPDRRAILDIGNVFKNEQLDLQTYITAHNFDWSRIAAVVMDEPYSDLTPNTGCPSAAARAAIQEREIRVAHVAGVISSLSPTTRLWVNFSEDEIYALRHCPSPPAIYRPYIDVVSLDNYNKPFSCPFPGSDCVRLDYEWLLANKPNPDQQLALVPGTFHKPDSPHQIDASTAAARLESYFQFADEMNAGHRNRPIVWLIAGFPADETYHPGLGTYYGLAAPGSQPIAAAWNRRWSRKPWPWTAPVILSLY